MLTESTLWTGGLVSGALFLILFTLLTRQSENIVNKRMRVGGATCAIFFFAALIFFTAALISGVP